MASISGTRQVVYTPTTNFAGTDSFNYSVSDGFLTDTATVTVTVVNGDGGGSTTPGGSGGETIVITEAGSSGDITVTVQIPAGVATDTLAMVYNQVVTPTGAAPQGYVLAGLAFTLEAYLNQVLQPGYAFSTPLTLTIEYSEADAAGVPGGEESLELRYWTGSDWSGDGITVVERDTAHNRLVVSIAHLTEFALLGQGVTFTYLPLIVKGFVSAPDLVITALSAAGGGITVTVKNQGNAGVTADFWLDVYFNPTATPTFNQPWDSIAPAGATWGVTADIPAGDSLTLTVGDAYYAAQYSSGSFPTNAQVYGYVDSLNYSTSTGAVYESDDSNNLFGPVISGSSGAPASVSSQSNGPLAAELPQR